MQLFASTRDFQVALLQVIRHAGQPNPSRHRIAERLEVLAEKLGAQKPAQPKTPGSRPRKKKPEPTPVGRQVLVNIAQKEADRLNFLKIMLEGAASDVKSEMKHIRRRIDTIEVDAELDGNELAKADVEAKWEPSRFFAGQILDPIIKAVDHLADTLEDHQHLTQETDLAEAVRDFKNKIPDEGNWPKGKGEEHFNEVIKAFSSAATRVPTGLSKTSELTKLRETFDLITDVVKLMTGKSIAVPKIPKAVDPEDPRQLGFGFSASRRIANSQDLTVQLDAIWQASTHPRPSRLALGAALFNVADRLR